MNIFTYVRAAVTTRQAAIFYGLKVRANGMTCCPFHSDKHPSLKVDERYYCFGCHQTGDVIDFVSKLFHLASQDAARKLANDFGLHPTEPQAEALTIPKCTADEYDNTTNAQRLHEGQCASVLIAYKCLLKEWRKKYAPHPGDKEWDRHFVAAMGTLPRVSYLIDCIYSPDAAERASVMDELVANGTLNDIIRFLDAQQVSNEGWDSDERIA